MYLACAAHCTDCGAGDRGAGKCNDDGCDSLYAINITTKLCFPSGEFRCRCQSVLLLCALYIFYWFLYVLHVFVVAPVSST